MPGTTHSPARPWRRGLVGYRSGIAILLAGLTAAAPAALAAGRAHADVAPAAPPPVTVLTGSASRADGDIFISPYGDQSTYANGPEILSPSGKVLWFHSVPAGEEGIRLPATANLTSIGRSADQTVIDGIVQEIDIKTGKVLFQWNSAQHVPYSESEQPLPASASTPWDWFHVNAVHLAKDGSLLVDARDTSTTYDVSLRSGQISWQLGGRDSTFTEKAAPGQTLDSAGEIFAWQHDPEQVGPEKFTFFDNDSSGTPLLPYSRAVTVRLNFRTRVATLVASDDQPEGLSAPSQGNAQTTLNGDLLVGWGALPYFSEFSKSGKLLFNAEFPAGVNTYRAYQFRWPARTERHRQ